MIRPDYIKPGDKIGIVSTGSRISSDIIEKAVTLMQSSGYEVVVAENALSSFNQFAARDEERAADLQKMINDDSIKAIICSRGGYGSLRASELVNWERLQKQPKWVVGFSDVTVLHSKLNKMRIASIHGVMPKYFLDEEKPSVSFNLLLDALTGRGISYDIPASIYNREGKVKAEITGGNLSILYSLRGTKYDIDTKGKILFIEDLDEYKYHIDRMLMNLKAGGKLEGLAGLVVGNFTAIKDNDTPFGKTTEEIILDSVKEYGYPVMFDFPAGHIKNNFPLIFGQEAELNVDKDGVKFKQNK
jgi:muramoyltetrapeptide carboxypeptidase